MLVLCAVTTTLFAYSGGQRGAIKGRTFLPKAPQWDGY